MVVAAVAILALEKKVETKRDMEMDERAKSTNTTRSRVTSTWRRTLPYWKNHNSGINGLSYPEDYSNQNDTQEVQEEGGNCPGDKVDSISESHYSHLLL